MKLAVCNEFFEGWEIERVFDYAARIGCDGVEIAPFTLAESVHDVSSGNRRDIRRAAEAAGVEIVGLHWLLVKPAGLYINHPDRQVWQRTQDYVKALIDFCGDLGGTVMIHGSPQQRNIEEGWNAGDCFSRAVELFAGCADLMANRGVTYCIEPLTDQETNFVTCVAEALKLVEAVGHPNFQTMVDCRAASTEEGSHSEVIAQAGNAMRHVHVNDPNLRGPGFGELQFTPILKTLQELRYSGYVSVEVFDFEPDPETIAARSIGYLKGILEGLAAG
ncbi:MAG: sugar phosphate isomerase/epimerase [Candidatus Latescibacteria bacterium]|nr:sugar phosphate isomerase/epimerase [Candidatus Latescibacterota bacterium]